MAIPFAVPAGMALKSLIAKLGIGGAKAAAARGLGAGINAAGKYASVQGPRMAASGAFKKGLGNAVFGNMDKGEIIGRLAPDAMFGGLAALQTPGDIGDKLIAGTTSALGGGLGGIALSRGASRLGINGVGNYMADMAGSIGGDMVGMGLGDNLMRGKDIIAGGQGMTPYERMSEEQQRQFAEQIRQQTLSGAGLVPGVQQRYFDNTGMI